MPGIAPAGPAGGFAGIAIPGIAIPGIENVSCAPVGGAVVAAFAGGFLAFAPGVLGAAFTAGLGLAGDMSMPGMLGSIGCAAAGAAHNSGSAAITAKRVTHPLLPAAGR
ncbi:hypothetical protein [Phenylobacterium hankyongense]|uniref:hypothetical protein n=1 Tax=Phenylobacterium hankyongense TaxID=1813876 RepID=UPI0026A949F2